MTTPALTNAAARVPRLRSAWEALRPHLPALLFLALMAWAYWHRIDAWRIDDDEEGYLYAAWRISRGELPYRDFLTPQLPAFLFPGGLWLALFGPQAAVLRAWSALLMLVAGFATYLTGRRLFGPAAGLAALAVVLLSDDLFPLARAWRPEATMLALGALGLYAFVRADEAGRRRGMALASLLFGAALLAKLFGLLPWAGVGLYLGADALTRGRGARRAAGDLAALFLPGAALVALVMGGFQLLTPETVQAVLVHHLRQGGGLGPAAVVAKTLEFYGRALSWHAPLLAFVPLGIFAAWRLAGRRGLVVPWALPTVLVFFLLTRTLFARHLVYLLPTLGLLLGAAVAWLLANLALGPRARLAAGATIVAAVVLPFAFDDIEGWAREEVGTARLAAMIQALSPPASRIMADYPGIAFYGGRATTYSGAGLSEGATESGQITGARLWEEMRAGDVTLVLIDQDTQNGQLKDLVDFDDWLAKVRGSYRRLGKLYRQYQPLDVYRRNDQPGLGLDFGPLSLEAAAVSPATVEAGGQAAVTAVLRADERPDKAYTAFLHLVGPDGQTWATGDTFMNNALYRGSEEWEPEEVVALPMALTVPPGTPPGDYALRLGLYDAGSGERLAWTAPDGATGDAWDVGRIAVRPPSRPPPAPTGTPLGAVGPMQLLRVEVPESAAAGSPLSLRPGWRALRAPGADLELALRLRGRDTRAAFDSLTTVSPQWPSSGWRAGDQITWPVTMVVPAIAPGGDYTVSLGWQTAGGQPLGPPLEVGAIRVEALGPFSTTPPPIARPVNAALEGGFSLLGSDLPASAGTGELALTLFWRAAGGIEQAAAYTTLVHVVDAAGQVVAQSDGPPERPTTSWRPGEVIADRRSVTLPADLPAGDYTVLAGLYDASNPAYPRLAVTVDGAAREDGRVPLGTLTVGR